MPSPFSRILLTGLLLSLPQAAHAACVITPSSPANGATVSQSPTVRWTGTCSAWQAQFDTSPDFSSPDHASPWGELRRYQIGEETWDGFQAGSWAAGVYWRVRGKEMGGAITTGAISRRMFMDPDQDDDGTSVGAGDCDDGDPTVHPGAAETCDGADQNCDAVADEGLPTTVWFLDGDEDGVGDPTMPMDLCGAMEPDYVPEGTDCNDADPAIHPGVEETCEDNQDNNCDNLTDRQDLSCPLANGITGIVLIVVDTLRGDRVGCAYNQDKMPRVEQKAATGACFSDARSSAPWTLPSSTSLMTGLHVPSHGLWTGTSPDLDPAILTAPELLSPYGFSSALLTSNALASTHGLAGRYDQGLVPDGELYIGDEVRDEQLIERTGETLNDLGISPGDRFYFHYQFLAPHAPLCPPDAATTTFGGVDLCNDENEVIKNAAEGGNVPMVTGALGLYDDEVAWVDEAILRLLNQLEARHLLETTLVAITSDHGEAFMTHDNWGHGTGLTRDQTHVPLVFFGPGVPENTVVPWTVSGVDVLPTLMDLAGIPLPEHLEGRSLKFMMEDPSDAPPYRAWSSLLFDNGTLHTALTTTAQDDTVWTLIRRESADTTSHLLYHDESDWDQENNLINSILGRDVAEEMGPMLGDLILDYGEWYDAYYGG